MLAAIGWTRAKKFFPTTPDLDDQFSFILRKLLQSAKTDPFCKSNALVTVRGDGTCHIVDFPGKVNPGDTERISQCQLNLLMTQDEWQISWHQLQLDELSSLRFTRAMEDASDTETDLRFWVTSNAETVALYMDAKLELLRNFLDQNLPHIAGKTADSVEIASCIAIDDTEEILSILTGHSYPCCGRQPWIRHRRLKLELVEKWATATLKLLITNNIAPLTDLDTVDELHRYAQEYDLRTLHIVQDVLRACVNEASGMSGSSIPDCFTNNCNLLNGNDGSRQPHTRDIRNAEPTCCGTQDLDARQEVQAHCVLDFSRSPASHKMRKPAVEDTQCATCCESLQNYDEQYWSGLVCFPKDTDSTDHLQVHTKATLWKLGRLVGDFISTVC